MTLPQTSHRAHSIAIEWLSDEHDCETCGWSEAEGALVSIDGQQKLALEPFAHCFDSTNWCFSTIMALIIAELGGYVILDGTPVVDTIDPDGKIAIDLARDIIHDKASNSYGQGMQAKIDGITILDWPSEALGEAPPPITPRAKPGADRRPSWCGLHARLDPPRMDHAIGHELSFRLRHA